MRGVGPVRRRTGRRGRGRPEASQESRHAPRRSTPPSIFALAAILATLGPLQAQDAPARGGHVALVQDEILDAIRPLLDRKEAEGYAVRVVYLSNVPEVGRDRAESIREFLRSRGEELSVPPDPAGVL